MIQIDDMTTTAMDAADTLTDAAPAIELPTMPSYYHSHPMAVDAYLGGLMAAREAIIATMDAHGYDGNIALCAAHRTVSAQWQAVWDAREVKEAAEKADREAAEHAMLDHPGDDEMFTLGELFGDDEYEKAANSHDAVEAAWGETMLQEDAR